MRIAEIQSKISPLFRVYGITYAALFGSVSRGDDRVDSDIDILIRLGKPIGMLAYLKLVGQMEESLGRKVDLVTENSLNKFVKPYVLSDLKTIYEG